MDYKINLVPIGSFYFGNEKKFNPFGEERSNYLVESLLFPQQTTLLGMLRYSLLFKLLKVKGDTELSEEQLIGKNSFQENGSSEWGIIQKLSPVFVEKEGKLYAEAGLNYQKSNERLVTLTPVRVPEGTFMKERKLFFWDGYNPKNIFKHYLSVYGEPINEKDLLSYEDIFIPYLRPGNRKNRNGESEEEGFYKQTRYKLKPGMSFCFYLRTTQELVPGNFSALVGGDQSVFRVSVEPAAYVLEAGKPEQNKPGIIKLLSDTFIDNSDEDDLLLSIVEMKDFRYIRTKLKQDYNYANLGQSDDSKESEDIRPVLSRKIRMIGKGSVFYCKNIVKFAGKIEEKEAFRNIGYNWYEVMETEINQESEKEDWEFAKLMYFYFRNKSEN